jgi:hypothetical protein
LTLHKENSIMNTPSQQHASISTVLQNIGIAILSSAIFALALRTGYQAEQANTPAQQRAQ